MKVNVSRPVTRCHQASAGWVVLGLGIPTGSEGRGIHRKLLGLDVHGYIGGTPKGSLHRVTSGNLFIPIIS